MPCVLGPLRGVDERDRLVADPAEEALEHRQPDDAGVVGADVALDRISTVRRQLRRPATRTGARGARPAAGTAAGLVGLGRGEVDGERHELAGQRQLHHVGDRVAGLVLGLAGAGAEVRRDDDRRRARTAATRSSARSSNTSRAAPAMTPSRMASASAASSTMPPRATLMTRSVGLALSSRSRPMRPVGLRRLRQVDGEEVGLGDDLVERQQLDAELAGPLGRHERVVGDEAHAEAAGPVGDELADAAEADDAERLVGQLDALPPAALPAPGDERRVGLGHVAGLGQQQRHRVLGGRHDVALRRVDDHHAAASWPPRRRRCRARCRPGRRRAGRCRRRAPRR